jgi:ribosomal protein L4
MEKGKSEEGGCVLFGWQDAVVEIPRGGLLRMTRRFSLWVGGSITAGPTVDSEWGT